MRFGLVIGAEARFVLFGSGRAGLHLDRSPSSHSYGYVCSADRHTCFAHHALIPEPFMQHAGLRISVRELEAFHDRFECG